MRSGSACSMASHSTDRLERWVDAHVVLDRGLVSEVSGERRDVGAADADRRTAAGDGSPMNAIRRGTRIAIAVARKDALAELRGRHATVSTLFFAAVVLLLFGFALGPDSARLSAAAPGLLWLAIVFAGILAVGRLHQLETDDGALEHLAAYPVDRRALYAGKALGGFAVMLVLGIVLLGRRRDPLRGRGRIGADSRCW